MRSRADENEEREATGVGIRFWGGRKGGLGWRLPLGAVGQASVGGGGKTGEEGKSTMVGAHWTLQVESQSFPNLASWDSG